MTELIEEFEVVLKFQTVVNCETGEITTNCIKKSIDKVVKPAEIKESKPRTKKSKKEESSDPKVVLEDNKLCLNQATVDLVGIEPGDKVDIGYKKQGKSMIPVIYKDDKKGNKVTKSLTVACRGSKHDELAKYGTEFDVVPHSEEGMFILKSGDLELEESLDEDSDEAIDSVIDVDIQDLLNSNEDDSIKEISAFEFKL